MRIGLLAGAGLSLAFSGWIYLANRVPIFDRISIERNLAAAAILGVLAFIPVLSFFREPAGLLLQLLEIISEDLQRHLALLAAVGSDDGRT